MCALEKGFQEYYICEVHQDLRQSFPGNCPECGKELVLVRADVISKTRLARELFSVDLLSSDEDVSKAPEKEPKIVNAKDLKEAPKLSEKSEFAKMLEQFTPQQIAEAVAEVHSEKSLKPEQLRRMQQVDMLKRVFQTITRDIQTSRTWGEAFKQSFLESKQTTNDRQGEIENLIAQLDTFSARIKKEPSLTVDELLTEAMRNLLKDYDAAYIGGLIDRGGHLAEARSQEEVQEQYVKVFQFLRYRKDYLGAQNLVEGTIFADKFEAARKDLAKTVDQRTEYGGGVIPVEQALREKVEKKFTAEILANYRKQGMTQEQIENFKKTTIDESTAHLMNEYISKTNNGLPFQSSNSDENRIMEEYKDMIGTGEWHNFSDASWDKITDEIIINAPLIVLSGGAASLARAGVSAGARAVIGATRIGSLALKAADVARVGGEATRLGKTLYQAGRLGGLLVEGASFESVHNVLRGDWKAIAELWNDFPKWAKQVAISSATLGAFKFSGQFAGKLESLLTKHLTQVSDNAVGKAIQHLLISKNIEAATMLMVAAVQNGAANGSLEDFDWLTEIAHAYVTAGALHLSGSVAKPVLSAGAKVFNSKKIVTLVPAEEGKAIPVEGKVAEKKNELKLVENEEAKVEPKEVAKYEVKVEQKEEAKVEPKSLADSFEIFENEKIKSPKELVGSFLEALKSDSMSSEMKLNTIISVFERIRKETNPKAFDRYFTPEMMNFLQEIEAKDKGLSKKSESLFGELNNVDVASEGVAVLEKQMLEAVGKALDKNYQLSAEEYTAFEKVYKSYLDAARAHRADGGGVIARFARESRSVTEDSVLKQYQLRYQEVDYYRDLGREILDRARLESNDKVSRMPYEATTSVTGEEIIVERNSERKKFAEVVNRKSVFVIGDTHGSYEAFERSLETAGIVKVATNEAGQKTVEWTGGDTKVVLLGDVFDRGRDGLKILDLVKQLDGKGRFVINVGNHETIVLQAGFGTISEPTLYGWLYSQGGLETVKGLAEADPVKYENLVSELSQLQKTLGELDAKGKDKSLTVEQKAQHQKDWKKSLKELKEKYGPQIAELVKTEVIGSKPGEKYGDLIKNFKVVEQMDDVLYVHSEISPQLLYLVAGGGVDRVNDLWRRAFERAAYGKEKVREDGSVVQLGPQSKYLDKLILSPYNDAFWSRLLSEKKIPSASGRKQASEGHIGSVADLLKRAGINSLVIGHTPSNLFSKVGQTAEGKKYFDGAEDNKQFTVGVGDLNIIFNDIALSPGVSKETGPRVGGVRITPELSAQGAVEFINLTGVYQESIGEPSVQSKTLQKAVGETSNPKNSDQLSSAGDHSLRLVGTKNALEGIGTDISKVHVLDYGDFSAFAESFNKANPEGFKDKAYEVISVKEDRVLAFDAEGKLKFYESRDAFLESAEKARVSQNRLGQGGFAYAKNVEKTVDNIIAQAAETKPVLDRILDEVSAETSGKSLKAPLKAKPTILLKAEQWQWFEKKEFFRLGDLVRGTIVYDSIVDLGAGLKAIKTHPDVKRVSISDRVGDIYGDTKGANLCRDVLLNVEFKNGHVGEIQLHIKEVIGAKNDGISVPKSYLDLIPGILDFTPEERAIAAGINAKIKKTIALPEYTTEGTFIEPHEVYEITRAMSENPTGAEKTLRIKLIKLNEAAFGSAWDLYIDRDLVKSGKLFLVNRW